MNLQLDKLVGMEAVAQAAQVADVSRADAVDSKLNELVEREMVVAVLIEFTNVRAGDVVYGQLEKTIGVKAVVAERMQGGNVIRAGGKDESAASAAVAKGSFANQRSGVAHHLELGFGPRLLPVLESGPGSPRNRK